MIMIINITNLFFSCTFITGWKSVLTENERVYYNLFLKEYMSDKSDSPDMENIVVHKHLWHSKSTVLFYTFAQLDDCTLQPHL